eukprot:jgi/Hompol1/3004/HPOL_003080-RA
MESLTQPSSTAAELPPELPPGAQLLNEFISEAEEMELMRFIDQQAWSGNGIPPNPELKRRTQQYGFFQIVFGPVIASLSLLSPCIMKFAPQKPQKPQKDNAVTADAITSESTLLKPVQVLLPRRSLIVISGPARNNMTHEISKEAVEVLPDGRTIQRDRRVSITFRKILESALENIRAAESSISTDTATDSSASSMPLVSI